MEVPMSASQQDEMLDKRFTYHAPFGDQPERYAKMRAAALGAAPEAGDG